MITVLMGSIEIQGATINSISGSHHFSSPKTQSLPVITATSTEILEQDQFGDEIVALVRFEPHESTQYAWLQLYPFGRALFSGPTMDTDVVQLQFGHPKISTVQMPVDWEAVFGEHTSPRCVVVVGGKNTGKSTFAKHFLNQHLSIGSPSVCYLDLDPGQPEFSVPGTVSCSVVSDFVLTSNAFTPLNNITTRAHWIGETSPKEDPSHYLACIKDLISRVATSEERPIIVNTPGWIKGTGLELLLATIAILDSTFPQDVGVVALGRCEIPNLLPPHVKTFSFDAQDSKIVSSAADLRTINIISTFHQTYGVWSAVPLVESPMWRVSYDVSDKKQGVTGVSILREVLDDTDIVAAVNGTIVALVRYRDFTDADIRINYGRTGIGILANDGAPLDPSCSECIGLAIIATMNLRNKSMDLITSISTSSFQELEDSGDALVLSTGNIDMPLQIMTSSDKITSMRPYLTDTPGEGIGWQSWHVRRNIGRRRQ